MLYLRSFNLYEPNPVKEMALTPLIQFPVFAPNPANPPHNRPATEVRFSRWNNANAEKFNREKRTQKEIEDKRRFQKRYDSALNIAHNYNPAPPNPIFKSTGTPSSPSKPSIQGKKSKYSKTPLTPQNSLDRHPAFRPLFKHRRLPKKKVTPTPSNENEESEGETQEKYTANVKIDRKGVSYEFPEAPFVYQYSYTETPKVKPVGIREPLMAPFEPATMGRPWTGRKPLPPSKKKLPEFDSFKLPPPHKKGVKTVQTPGPYLPGSGPKYVRSREEILGEPLTKEEVKELVESCKKWKRQLNMGRDGFTHNMLDNIHALWKRRRVCKIKCKGVCTVDMDNVREQLEEKTGGKIIHSSGGVIFLFRGRNYNFRTRPRFPLMLWKPVTPVYPRLIKRVPDGLTLEEATEMRRKGRNLPPICKLAKNGVYFELVKNVREAFEACELVRINCQGLNGSDYRKIGAKLKDLVPCVLISFEHEHILIWRGQDWKSSLPVLKNDVYRVKELEANAATYTGPTGEGQTEFSTASTSTVTNSMAIKSSIEEIEGNSDSSSIEDGESERSRDHGKGRVGDFKALIDSETLSASCEIYGSQNPLSQVKELEVDAATCVRPIVEGQTELLEASTSTVTSSIVMKTSNEEIDTKSNSSSVESVEAEGSSDHRNEFIDDSETISASCEIGSQNPLSQVKELEADAATCVSPTVGDQTELREDATSAVTNSITMKTSIEEINTKSYSSSVEGMEAEGSRDHRNEVVGDFMASVDFDTLSTPGEIHGSQKTLSQVTYAVDSDSLMDVNGSKEVFDCSNTNLNDNILSPVSETFLGSNDLLEPVSLVPLAASKFDDVSEDKKLINELPSSIAPAVGGVHLLLKLAVESGSAILLEDSSLDADIVYEKVVALAKSAPPGPVFRHGLKKLAVQGCDEQPNDDLATKEPGKTDHKVTISSRQGTGKKSSKRSSMEDIRADLLNVAPRGSLRVDELAKLLS